MSTDFDQILDPEEDAFLLRSSLNFPVVGIGASAGGFPAIERLLESLPSDIGMAFVVVMHLSPEQPSMADAIFQRSTRMPVCVVSDDLPIEPDHVYVIPPGRSLTMTDGHLRLGRLERMPSRHIAIDQFFRSLAEVHRERAIAIVLSGSGADGAQGVKRVKERGGITLVQSPADAEYDSMPLHAIAAGGADFILPVADMAQKLIDVWANARLIQLPHPPSDLRTEGLPTPEAEVVAEEAMLAIMELLRERTTHDFTRYKRATLLRRLERRMQVTRQQTLPAYAAFLQANQQETMLLLQDMLISVTSFFRDRLAFDALERTVVAELFEDRSSAERVRAWVAGCATGEEAYSVAMLLLEHASNAGALTGVQVFATDIDERALAIGRTGLYADSIATDVPPVRLRQFFDRQPGQYQVSRTLRERITFSAHNLLRDPPFSRLHLVCCRNLLIYLDRAAQRQLLETFHFALRPGGLLFLGSAETADAAPEHFTIVDRKNRIYRASVVLVERRVPAALGVPMSYLPPVVAPASIRKELLDDIRLQLQGENASAFAVVDQQLKVAYLSEPATRFLRLHSGELSAQLLHLVLPELRLALRAALAHAEQQGEAVEARRVRTLRGDQTLAVQMTIHPVRQVRHAHAAKGWLIVRFEEVTLTAGDDVLSRSEIAVQAEHDLFSLTEQLSAAIGESDSSSEALRASNEELQSVNEELRSTTEELETSKEELQSVNEELTTVNYDLKHHLEISAKAHDDLQNFLVASEMATIFVDRALRIQRFTPRATGIFNLIATDNTRPLFDITHRLDYPQMEADAREAFDSLRPIEREVASVDGRWFLARVLPYRSSDDRIEGVVLNFIDITGRRQAEQTMRAGEEQLHLLFDSSADYIIIFLDAQGRITRWNKGAEHALGFTEAEAKGQPCDIIFTPEDRAAGAPAEEKRCARQNGRAEDERWHLRKDGTRVYFSGVLVSLASGAEKGFAKIARDLTQARLAEQQRDDLLASEQSLRAQLQEANALKDEFLAVMSHELKNPLNLIALNAQMLAFHPEARSGTLASIAKTIGESVRSQAQLIDDLLDLSRVQTGKLSLSLQDVHCDELVKRIVTAVQPDAQARNVALNLRIELGDYLLHADPVRIEQIVWNLVSNALKFTPAGGTVDISLEKDKTLMRLKVTDTGEGIKPEYLPVIFEMFQQAGARATTRGKAGLGIGLNIVKRLVEAHGGEVRAESAGLGRGATFTVMLPCQRMQAKSNSSADQVLQLQGMRILLVEDDQDALQMFGKLLESSGAVVTTAASAQVALACAAPDLFDLIVSDIAMPGMDGYAMLKQLRESGLRDVPAIALTGFARPDDRQRALAAGFDEHLGKPFQLAAFTSAVERIGTGRSEET
ncbi:MAG: PAS domain S-box protein [Pseudomonas sp.]|uniref:chemotaxis protein CheB n=1 Tax=Pseudomonas sp. TaxID=306 RepID=UPI00122BEAEB|nr:chemotaxis protein CheB [Pseudomonas sp.]RZI69775.1 MAG: PAS domain S-box protein [Pseudomonas sp.]